MEYESLGKRLRERRKERGLTLDQVAKGSGLGTGTVSDLEQGRQKGTTKLHLVAAFLGVHVEWLANGEGPKEVSTTIQDEASTYRVHNILVSPDGARVGAEWDKIEGDEYRKLAREFIEGLVAAQKRAAARRPELANSARTKTLKNKARASLSRE